MTNYAKKITILIKNILIPTAQFYLTKINLYLKNDYPQGLDEIVAKKDLAVTDQSVNSYLAAIKHHPEYAYIQDIKKISMLHEDVLYLLRFFAIACKGVVVEFGTYVGGSTIALASGRKMYNLDPIISVEPGGKAPHPHIPSDDIYGDLLKNIKKFDLEKYVWVKKGFSNQQDVYDFIESKVSSKGIGLLFIDADGNVERDVELYASLLNDKSVLVFDDYNSDYAPEKCELIRKWVTRAESEGLVTTIGIFGWGTWIGLYNKA